MKPLSQALAILALLSSGSAAADLTQSGFLDDYSRLEKIPGTDNDYRWLASGARDQLAKVTTIFVPQPTVVVAADSKFKGAKPDDLKAVADVFQAVLTDELGKDFIIAQMPAVGVLVLNVGITNVYLKKPRKHIWNFVPVALVVGTVKNKVFDSFQQNINLTGANFEAELISYENGEELGNLVIQTGSRADKDRFESWGEFEAELRTWARRLDCRITNAKQGTDKDCSAIVVSVEKN